MKACEQLRRAFGFGIALILAGAAISAAQAQAPSAPDDVEATPTASSGVPPISVTWDSVPGATSYIVYRSTTSGDETFYGTSTTDSFLDTHVSAGPPLVYYYKVAAVNAGGAGPESEETGSPTPLPLSPGSGEDAGTPIDGGTRYYCEDAALGGFDWFITLNGWFPQVLGSSSAISPGGRVVDMAYADDGTLTFYDVDVPTTGWYNIDFRYAYSGGLFGGVNNREMGLAINGVPITSTQRFPITGNFETYEDSILQERLEAGENTVQMFATQAWGVSRVDTLTVTSAAGPGPGAPANLTAVPGDHQLTLSWMSGGNSTEYQIYRGENKSDSEAVTPVGTTTATTATTFTDTGLVNGTTYYYNVSATNAIGISPDSNEITAVPAIPPTPPATPAGVTATPGDGIVTVSWESVAGATAYAIYRGTTAGGEAKTPITTVPSPATSFTNTGLANGTAYYYKVAAVNSAGSSAESAEVTATPIEVTSLHIDCGGPAAAPFVADTAFVGGSTIDHANTIDLTAVTNPAPVAVYQSARTGNFSYVLSGFLPGSTHTVRLHFAETYFGTAGSRTFDVSVNGTQVLTDFDIFAAAGAKNKANIQQFTETADKNGSFTIAFTSVVNNSLVSGIEVL